MLLVLAILGLIIQAFTLQPHQGPGVSPFAPRHAKQAQQPLLSQVGLDSIGDYNCRCINLRSAVQSAYVMCQALACRLTIRFSLTLQSGLYTCLNTLHVSTSRSPPIASPVIVTIIWCSLSDRMAWQ